MQMNDILIISNCVLITTLILYIILSSIKFRRLKDDMESMILEQDKMNFRLFIAEKKQKMFQEKLKG